MKNAPDNAFLTFVAIQAALKVGEILRKGFVEELEITAKPGHQNIVTQYDFLAEKSIISSIKEHFPHHSFLAEESGSAIVNDRSIVWIIDPLDGTVNFAHRLPLFTISIAAYLGEDGLCGVIYQPITNELFVAEKGKGAYLNGFKLSVSKTSKLEDSILGVGFPYESSHSPYINHFSKLIQSNASFRNLGSAALALAYVAAGKLDGFWIDHLCPWDLAAGKLLISEAGGKVTRYDNSEAKILDSSNIIATNQLLHKLVIQNFK